MAISLRDARVLRDHLLASSDWDRAGHAYASGHDDYFATCHTAGVWQRQVFQEQTPEARSAAAEGDAVDRGGSYARAGLPFSGPDLPMDDSVRARFFGEV